MQLYLMRHGQAEDPSNDPEQGLTKEGKNAIKKIARELQQKSVHPKQIFHSTKKRAQQTARIVSEIISPDSLPHTMENLNPGDNPAILIDTINQWTDDTLIVSHLPFIPSLLDLLSQEHNPVRFEPGTVVCLSRSGTQWQLEWATNQ